MCKIKRFYRSHLPKQELGAIHLGRFRVEIKKHLVEDKEKIDVVSGANFEKVLNDFAKTHSNEN